LLDELGKNKLLFASYGDSLEVEVRRVFEELGFTVMEVLPDRDDLILQYNDRIAVVEIKGVLRKSAAERHAAQLEKWVSSYFSDKGIRPKGILVANPYCEVPLIDRKEDAFPSQMRPYSEAREHCLITGLQLLCLYLDCKEDEEKKARMIHLLFNTKGVFSEYQDWTQFIELAKTVETTS